MSEAPFKGKSILVTGGTGSIGSEIVRQLLRGKAGVVRIFSRGETKQWLLSAELGTCPNVRFLIGDVRDKDRLYRAMNGVEVVFHAAALKHVASCEYNPFEAVQTNVIGTQHVIEAALDTGVKVVVGISTDKATTPVGVMGLTKLLAEKITTAASVWSGQVKLGCVRFGNVIGSRGSVAPMMKTQIEEGKAVTITDKRMTRFVMTIPDAAKLVLEAGAMLQEGKECKGGEVFILKMPALNILDLANVMLERLDAYYSKIKVIGRRPGERLHEQLLTREEAFRVQELNGMMILPPEWRHGSRNDCPVAREKYISNAGRRLIHKEIEELLERAGVFDD